MNDFGQVTDEQGFDHPVLLASEKIHNSNVQSPRRSISTTRPFTKVYWELLLNAGYASKACAFGTLQSSRGDSSLSMPRLDDFPRLCGGIIQLEVLVAVEVSLICPRFIKQQTKTSAISLGRRYISSEARLYCGANLNKRTHLPGIGFPSAATLGLAVEPDRGYMDEEMEQRPREQTTEKGPDERILILSAWHQQHHNLERRGRVALA
ncbi:hypothetical protein BDK51DRAFT_36493 [Blyttiomyces helicus]|uniref:Uncharacterized protein n=1 Tax=Blyttiomyces helicus TaxID=388810 RepID=A0A4P9WFU4_9FUNG|nr:hypothetical protein BDK51DRAFT_36493 [Blyttiomyces helicus]|eukprot:RKO90653.1 hypothetical protein BDK51DRAFT_36493 [Blyttiomyces helicus]